jgi:hypothetical protein
MLIREDDLIGCDAHLPRVLRLPTDTFLFAFFLIAVVCENAETGEKLLELHLPVEDDGCGDDD